MANKPTVQDGVDRIERRRRSRDVEALPNWEMIVLQRMAGRVRSLTDAPTSESAADGDGSWEEGALLALRRRLRDLHSK